ncbi:S8 family serine peptidase [Saccharomonospora xinjiangensis]|uniref:Subtilisin-like serine protease n=1 Tax=Saccharomonospora xinjiangensis XJ-54 TaxID=882086 RepID=I0V3W5_9PSEU|nr:S8 family serine peptidase [Saccharomonospora xinjiangensis]EID54818.1 subtilisin-like serine protease [Saccharomonospora xinjiangensis XJ-54]
MARQPWMRRLGVATAVSAVAVLGLGVPQATAGQQDPLPSPEPGDEQLDREDRILLEKAEKAGKSSVTLLVAAERGKADTAESELSSLGGTVRDTNEKLDYLKVTIPIAKAEQAQKLRSVHAVDVDGLIARDEPEPLGATDPAPQPAPGTDTPKSNPYLPTRDTKADRFTTLFPRWDGRGTTIAILDSGVDLDHPALAKTSTGERKIVDWYTANSPSSGDGTWVKMSSETHSGAFTAQGREWTAPDGEHTFGLFSETAGDLGSGSSELGGDVNRDSDREDSWGVLLDTASKEVRVDLDGDGDFTDEKPMRDYAVNHDIGFFGEDDPATGVVDRMAFVVQTDQPGYVNIGLSAGAHGSHVAGIAAGNDLFGGKMDGAAPGAKLMSVKACLSTPSCTSSGLVDGVIYAATHGADIVNISIGGLPALNDGNNARAELYNRIIDTYDVQLFISAGNSGAGANSVGDPSVATDALSVGSYITDDTWLSNYGSVSSEEESLHPFSSRGPREDGGFKPNIVAPGAAVSTTPRWQPGSAVPGTYELPAGYGMFNGTSMAAPQATGSGALLVSAYKSIYGKRPEPSVLRSAMTSTARFVDGVPAYAQGAGLVDTMRALDVLRGSEHADVTTSVEVNTVLSHQLSTPDTGVGIHDREGVQVGESYTRTYTLERKTGPKRPVTYRASWVGNDGTFSSQRTVTLPLGQPVTFDVRVKPSKTGAHSALLRLDDRRTFGYDVQTMNVVFAPLEFAEQDGFTAKASGTVGRNQVSKVFVRVPEGTASMKVDMAAGGDAGKGQVRFVRYDPTGIPVDSTSSLACYNPDAGGGCPGGTATSRTLTDPMPGVWEIVVEARRTSDAATSPWSLTMAVQGASVEPNPDVLPEVTLGEPVSREYTVTNRLGSFTGALEGVPLDSARKERPSIGEGEQQSYDVTVPAGATSLTATIGSVSDGGADLDLFVYDCTSGTCQLADYTADGDSEESVTVANPVAGTWRVEIDAYAVPAGTTEYDYLDTYAVQGLGVVEVADEPQERATGATWTAQATVTANGDPGEGRLLRGVLTVRTTDDLRVGSTEVLVESVTG